MICWYAYDHLMFASILAFEEIQRIRSQRIYSVNHEDPQVINRNHLERTIELVNCIMELSQESMYLLLHNILYVQQMEQQFRNYYQNTLY